jgi:hypothetical protein
VRIGRRERFFSAAAHSTISTVTLPSFVIFTVRRFIWPPTSCWRPRSICAALFVCLALTVDAKNAFVHFPAGAGQVCTVVHRKNLVSGSKVVRPSSRPNAWFAQSRCLQRAQLQRRIGREGRRDKRLHWLSNHIRFDVGAQPRTVFSRQWCCEGFL